jgi:hypothetical protein
MAVFLLLQGIFAVVGKRLIGVSFRFVFFFRLSENLWGMTGDCKRGWECDAAYGGCGCDSSGEDRVWPEGKEELDNAGQTPLTMFVERAHGTAVGGVGF